jgi:hypothetical protein
VNLRCKDGNIAVITWDYPDCLENIGRLVDVRSPMRVKGAGPSWLIRPITPELCSPHESNHVLCREQVTWSTVSTASCRSRSLHPASKTASASDATILVGSSVIKARPAWGLSRRMCRTQASSGGLGKWVMVILLS